MSLAVIIYLVAIAHVFSRGTIFRPIRDHGPTLWRDLAGCPLCAGTWIGMLGYGVYRYCPILIIVLGTGCIVGTATLALYGLIRRI